MRKRNKKLMHLGNLLSAVSSRRFKKLKQYELWGRWAELVGEAVADHAQPTAWRRQTLIVTVANNTWMQELHYLREEILQRIKDAFPKTRIDGIRFELGTIDRRTPSSATPPAHEPPPPLTNDEKEFARDTVRPIADEPTRETIRLLIERDLANKKSKNSGSSG